VDHLDATRARARAAAAAARPVGVAWPGRQAGGGERADGRAGEAFIFETDELIGIDWRSFW